MAHTEFNPRHLLVEVFANEGASLQQVAPLAQMERLVESVQGSVEGLNVQWRAQGETRVQRYGAKPQVWLHLQASAHVPMTCQRCLSEASIPLEIDQSYRFVATENEALDEDEDSEEDILVLSRDFDVLELLEDELIMALPPIPKHDQCPQAPSFEAADDDFSGGEQAKPNPFAVLQKLKREGGT
ncbi:MAG: DUF177 domain-containing protein [Rhodoferax sp.]|nr:MAG: DUF177 domain-containing protein [Rhodoferax sp.]